MARADPVRARDLAPSYVPPRPAARSSSPRWRDARWLVAILDRFHDGACIVDGGGEVLHANASLEDMSDGDDEFARVRSALAKVARDFLARATWNAEPPSAVAGSESTSVRTALDRYDLTPTLLPEGLVGLEPAVLVLVRPACPRLPSERELRERFGLTRREAEVALLLARGLSNRRIAERLLLSPFTVRHHAQRVLQKVGVRSRKVLLLHLLDRRGLI